MIIPHTPFITGDRLIPVKESAVQLSILKDGGDHYVLKLTSTYVREVRIK